MNVSVNKKNNIKIIGFMKFRKTYISNICFICILQMYLYSYFYIILIALIILATILLLILVSLFIKLIDILSSIFTSAEGSVTFMSKEINTSKNQKFPFGIYIINLDRKPERYEYVTNQLKNMGISNYQKWTAVDGFKTTDDILRNEGITQRLIDQGRGLAGCAASHVKLWKHIANNKLGWTLILEDDTNFHPKFIELFNEYWKEVPKDAKIIFPGYCGPEEIEESPEKIIEHAVMCLHGYMISWEGAQYLLDKLLPIDLPVDIPIDNHFKENSGSYIFNGNAIVSGIRPNDYKEQNGKRCMFNGIIYQNQQEAGSTIHKEETVF